MTSHFPRPRRGNLGTRQKSGQCRIVWTSDRLDTIEAGTAILVQVSGSGQILPCYVIAKLPQRSNTAGRTHEPVARCGIIECSTGLTERTSSPEPPPSSDPQLST